MEQAAPGFIQDIRPRDYKRWRTGYFKNSIGSLAKRWELRNRATPQKIQYSPSVFVEPIGRRPLTYEPDVSASATFSQSRQGLGVFKNLFHLPHLYWWPKKYTLKKGYFADWDKAFFGMGVRRSAALLVLIAALSLLALTQLGSNENPGAQPAAIYSTMGESTVIRSSGGSGSNDSGNGNARASQASTTSAPLTQDSQSPQLNTSPPTPGRGGSVPSLLPYTLNLPGQDVQVDGKRIIKTEPTSIIIN